MFFTCLDLNRPPGNDSTARERLEWPELRPCPPFPKHWTSHRDEYTDPSTEETMTTERVTVRVPLILGDQA